VATGRKLVQLARFDDGGGALIAPEGYFKSNGVFILDSFLLSVKNEDLTPLPPVRLAAFWRPWENYFKRIGNCKSDMKQ